MFARGSRYETAADGAYVDPRGRRIAYKLLRAMPSPPAIQVHAVGQGERLDVIAFNAYRDSEQFWRICDANGALRPEELTQTPGRRLLIPLPQR